MARFHPQLAWLERGLFRVLVALMVGAGLCCVTGLIVYVWIVAHRHLWIPMSAVAFGLVVACLSYRCLCGVIARALGHGALWSLVVMAVAGTWVD